MNLDPSLQLALRQRPPGRPAMLQKWRDLTFLHFAVESEAIQELLPEGLTVDTFEGKAWVGLVPFWMTGIRFPWLPQVPGTHTFCETNVRTYVRREGKEPGVWFFSLDAANALAVRWARRFYNLPYFRAEMAIKKEEVLRYESRRVSGPQGHRIEVEIGSPMEPPRPGTLEFFLIERYLLYAERAGRLFTGLVHHEPYRIREAKAKSVEETMIAAQGLPQRPWEHVCYSPGVDVEVFAIRPV